MFEFDNFNVSSLKYKYEIAIETENDRISYQRLSGMVNAIYNSLTLMNTEGTSVAVLLPNSPETVCSYYACSKAGFDCVSASDKISRAQAYELVIAHRPSVVIMPGFELLRLADIFADNGCTSAVCTGDEPQKQYFPAQFSFDRLLKENDYDYVRKTLKGSGRHIVFYGDSFNDTIPDTLYATALREPVFVDLPVFENAGALVFSSLFDIGHRCFITGEKSARLFKKKKVKNAVCFEGDELSFGGFSCDLHVVKQDSSKPYVCTCGGLFNPLKVENYLAAKFNLPVVCSLKDNKIRLIIEVEEIPSPQEGLVKELKNETSDLLYGINLPKSFVFRKKTV